LLVWWIFVSHLEARKFDKFLHQQIRPCILVLYIHEMQSDTSNRNDEMWQELSRHLKSPNQIVIYARLHVSVTSIKFHLLHPEITRIVNMSFKLVTAIFVAMHREVDRNANCRLTKLQLQRQRSTWFVCRIAYSTQTLNWREAYPDIARY